MYGIFHDSYFVGVLLRFTGAGGESSTKVKRY